MHLWANIEKVHFIHVSEKAKNDNGIEKLFFQLYRVW